MTARSSFGEAMIASAAVRPKTVYIETSVWGYDRERPKPCVAGALARVSTPLRQRRFLPYISNVVLDEIDEAPEAIQADVARHVSDVRPTLLALPKEADLLANRFIQESILPSRRRADGLHVACAIIHGIELVVSWNYRHIANQSKADAFRAVALLVGWPAKFEIHTPFEVLQWN
jgi:hypothetical protein